MTFENLQFIDQVWMFEVPVAGKLAHHVFEDGIVFRAEQNERLEGHSEGKFVVEIYKGPQMVERSVLSPGEITTKLQQLIP